MQKQDQSALSLIQTPRRKLAEDVTQQLLEAFRTLTPGTRLPSEKDLMRQLGVGRSTVREALKGLELLGIIEIRHGQGAFVASEEAAAKARLGGHSEITQALAKGVTRELLEARQIIEVAIAHLAAERRTEADLQDIEADLNAHERALQHHEGVTRHASRFHTLLAQAAHNEVLTSVFQSFLKLMVERGPRLYEMIDGFAVWELEQHRGLFEAVRDGAPDVAAERMHAHVVAMAEHYQHAGVA